MGSAVPESANGEAAPGATLGARLRQARLATGVSIREMGRRVHVSPSFISQVELGRAAPSIGTLYAIASELNLSMDSLMNAEHEPDDGNGSSAPEAAVSELPTARPAGAVAVAEGPPETTEVADTSTGATTAAAPAGSRPRPSVVSSHDGRSSPGHQRAADRPRIMLGDVTWERLTADDDPNVEFLRIIYPPGTESCPPDNLMHHNGWEYGHVLSGALDVQVSFQSVTLETGDSIDFASSRPHRLSNPYTEPCIAIWVVVGRQHRG